MSKDQKKWEKCGRLLSLNKLSDLLSFLDAINFINGNIIANPSEEKYRSVKLSTKNSIANAITTCKDGGMETLQAIGWNRIDNSSIHFPVGDNDLEVLKLGTNWLTDTVEGFSHFSHDKDKRVCQTVIQFRLSINGTILATGGFMDSETLKDLHSFICCYFKSDRWTEVNLLVFKSASLVKINSEEDLAKTLIDFDLVLE